MKKFISLLLIVLVSFFCSSCGKKENIVSPTDDVLNQKIYDYSMDLYKSVDEYVSYLEEKIKEESSEKLGDSIFFAVIERLNSLCVKSRKIYKDVCKLKYTAVDSEIIYNYVYYVDYDLFVIYNDAYASFDASSKSDRRFVISSLSNGNRNLYCKIKEYKNKLYNNESRS